MIEMPEIFGERLPFYDAEGNEIGHADSLLEEQYNPIETKSAAFPKTTYGDHTRRYTHPPPPYQTSDNKPDSLNRRNCYSEGRRVACSQFPGRGMGKSIKSLRKKYGR